MKIEIERKNSFSSANDANQKGSAMVIALFVLILMSVFVALALSRSASEAAAVGNETAEGRTFYAAQGSLEMMTRNFNKKFEVNLKPTSVDFDDVRTAVVPGLSAASGGRYTFNQEVLQTSNNTPVVLSGGPFSGLYAKRDSWRLRTTATDTFGVTAAANISTNAGVQVQLTRTILNNLVPIFQFGIFYDDDLEFHPGPRFDFGGRVHSNGSLFLQAQTGLYFSSKVTAANFIYTDVSKNGTAWTNWDDNVFVKNASGTYIQLQSNMGSVLASPVNGSAVVSSPAPTIPLPTAYNSATWPTNQNLFDGNLLANVPLLQLPLKLNSNNTNQNLDLAEVIKRGKQVGDLWNDGTGTVAAPNIVAVTTANSDDAITASERYYNKTGFRITLADKRNRLPGCSAATDSTTPKCGVRLDGDSVGQTSGTISGSLHGYQPLSLQNTTYTASRVNGDRLYSANNKETWIKIETVIYNPTTEVYDKSDITQDILALGVTEPAISTPGGVVTVTEPNYLTNGIDSRSIVKIQRYMIKGPVGTAISTTTGTSSPDNYISNIGDGSSYNFVVSGSVSSGNPCSSGGTFTRINGGDYTNGSYAFTGDDRSLTIKATINGTSRQCLAPFPINMFDTREGLNNDTTSVFDPATNYGNNVPWAGVMSMIDVDIKNLKDFLDGDWDTNMPTGTPYYTATGHVLRGNDIPQPTNVSPKSGGWVVYVSDRRGDFDFDGEYDMEDVYGNNDGTSGGTPQVGEDINRNGTLQRDVTNEAPLYSTNISPDLAAVFDHKYYRRGVRLINGQTIPGIYNTTTPANTIGFTFASENGVYVLGNYNATGIVSVGTPTPSTDYMPLSTTSGDIPASIAADAVTILSNNWSDAVSFTSPFTLSGRQATDTFDRFAMLSGDTLTSLNATPNQGGGDLKMNGGVHNFKRFLEDWGGNRLSYSGSLINLFNSHNNNGTFKCCNHVYSPPDRNWVFDATFLDVNRLPPGTPYFQYAQTTGFQRTND